MGSLDNDTLKYKGLKYMTEEVLCVASIWSY